MARRKRFGPMTPKDNRALKARMIDALGAPLAGNDVVAGPGREEIEKVMATPPPVRGMAGPSGWVGTEPGLGPRSHVDQEEGSGTMDDDDRRHLDQKADEELEDLKLEVADEVDVPLEEEGDNGDLTARQLGKVGGNMVKKLVRLGEEKLDEADDE